MHDGGVGVVYLGVVVVVTGFVVSFVVVGVVLVVVVGQADGATQYAPIRTNVGEHSHLVGPSGAGLAGDVHVASGVEQRTSR